jgi:cell division protein FtsN
VLQETADGSVRLVEPAAFAIGPLEADEPTYYVQLGSFKTEERAFSGWNELKTAHTDLLDSFQPIFARVDLGADKGVFYRVRVGGFANKDTPMSLCEALQARDQDCYMPVVAARSKTDIQQGPQVLPKAPSLMVDTHSDTGEKVAASGKLPEGFY